MDERAGPGGADWVADRFGVRLHTADESSHPLGSLVGLALRRNPLRAHLLVSTVLGKHVPVDPRVVHDTGLALGAAVVDLLGGGGDDVTVLGFAETATALGHCVAEALGAAYLHSTRRALTGVPEAGGFEEEHSHATSHQLLPQDPDLLRTGGTLVLVDDELSTGRTVRNTITALHTAAPHRRYVVAALVDLRGPEDRTALDGLARDLGVTVDVVSLARGAVAWPPGFPQQAADEVASRQSLPTGPEQPRIPGPVPGDVVRVDDAWPVGTREGGRHGMTAVDHRAARTAARTVAAALTGSIVGDRVLVLGTEELMYAPVLIGVELADLAPGRVVRTSSTTRSPVLVVDEPGYPIRNALSFPSHDDPQDGPGPRFAYNVLPTGAADGYSDVVVVLDRDADGPAFTSGLLEALRGCCRRVHVVVLPTHHPPPVPLHGPAFGSYRPDEVTWLLTDLSAVALEAPTQEREEAIQSGGAHYAESLPVEFQPDAAYLRVFEAALDASAERMAHAVGVVTEILLAERGPRPVLASLARAGTPVGALVRRWAQQQHGLDLSHYAVSIVRGRGIDLAALRFLAAHHDARDVVFLDGWTGKGAITRELAAAVAQANVELGAAFDPALAVLADPGSAVRTFGTREDFLVPSACLNSTVSGLVSRTVLNRRLLRPEAFHGAKFYRELADVDVSARFLDAVSDRFADVAAAVEQDWPRRQGGERTPTWAGWAEVEQISEEYGIGDTTLVKPGVGETTRVLLRRVPWAVLLRAGSADDVDLAHVRLLAEQRGVAIHEVDGLTYRCVGLIHPRFTRGATGADGLAAPIR